MVQSKRSLYTAISFIVAIILLALLPVFQVNALTSSSVTLSDPRTGETSNYTFNSSGFDTATTIRCVVLNLSLNADGSGAVSGITTTASSLDSTTIGGTWTVDNTTNSQLAITNSTGAIPSATEEVVWAGITNGDTEGTHYGTFTTYENVDCSTNPVDTVTVAFVYTDGTLVQLTIDPTLTFTVSGVADSELVNGAATTITSTATGINFLNDVTFTSNGISAHDLEVGTNATGGYTVYIRHTGPLSNGSDTIANHAGTNASPTGFPGAGAEAWGYTTEEIVAFDPNLWAGFNTTNEIVSQNTSALTGTETTRVGHQVGVASSTPAGTYQTTIVYTVASVY